MNKVIESKLLSPDKGSAIAHAHEFGVDLTLLLERLRLTPEDRVIQLQKKMVELERIRGASRALRQHG